MLSDYESELRTHYAQVRKRLRGDGEPKPVVIPKAPEPEPEPEQVPDFVMYVNTGGLVRTVIEPKRDFTLVVNKLPWEKEKRRSYQDVLRDVSRETGFPAEAIVGYQRTKSMVEARHYFWYRVTQECPHLSIAEIARRSNHNHTTVLHGVNRYEDLLNGVVNDMRKGPRSKAADVPREANGRYIRRRATGRKWSLNVSNKGVE